MSSLHDVNIRTDTDIELKRIADYVTNYQIKSELAYTTAHHCLVDSLGCAILALQYPACKKLLGPLIPGTQVPLGARVPGTDFILDPVIAAFNIGTLIRWLDFNDTWLAAEWAHPSDNLGAILAVADYESRRRLREGQAPFIIKDVLTALIKAEEIQGIIALENSFNRHGFDHVILVRVASAALATHLLNGTTQQIIDAVSQAWVDGATLRTYRHAPNTGSRKSWAAGDATSRGVWLAFITLLGEKGYPTALSTKKWGFYDSVMHGKPFKFARELKEYVMENILFKVAYPAEFHAQTAIECAIKLHPQIKNRLNEIEKIILTTHESAIRIISKIGPLYNPADRDHCLQYLVAVALLHGDLKAHYFEADFAADPRIDQLREKMVVEEDKQFSQDYLDPDKRSIANAVQLFFKNGDKTEKITIEYPLGHARRRQEGIPLLYAKFAENIKTHFSSQKVAQLLTLFQDQKATANLPVNELMDLLAENNHLA